VLVAAPALYRRSGVQEEIPSRKILSEKEEFS
jgi:hypothetical protein